MSRFSIALNFGERARVMCEKCGEEYWLDEVKQHVSKDCEEYQLHGKSTVQEWSLDDYT